MAASSSAAVAFKLPDQIEWKSPSSANAGVQQSILVGDPTKPGLYMVLTKWLPHHKSRPHFHPNDRFINVIKGTWWVGTGTKYSPDEAHAGGHLRDSLGQADALRRREGTRHILQIVGMDPNFHPRGGQIT